jgi:type VI protein secretion system component VasK
VVAAAAAATVTGTLLHRQAPFAVGAVVLLVVTVGRLAPYAPLLPRWITLGTAGLLLLVVGATYERRRQQAREAVAWVAQMR